jgi:hypothetical protein
MESLSDIQKMPTSIDKVHESCFRSYHILRQVLVMAERGDSSETIFQVANLLRENPVEVNN